MKSVTGTLDHRILINYRVDPEVMERALPAGFRPKLVGGWAIGGICQVTLSHMRPEGLPSLGAWRSHNAAHRIVVETEADGRTLEGVFVPRRDTSSALNAMTGGRLFPGAYRRAAFDVRAEDERFAVEVTDGSGERLVGIRASLCDTLRTESTFDDLEHVSAFFEAGNLGWSPRPHGGFDAIELVTQGWNMRPLEVDEEHSAFFSERPLFPAGSVEFDSALLMRGLQHSWVARPTLSRA